MSKLSWHKCNHASKHSSCCSSMVRFIFTTWAEALVPSHYSLTAKLKALLSLSNEGSETLHFPEIVFLGDFA